SPSTTPPPPRPPLFPYTTLFRSLFRGALSAKVNLNGLSDMLREQGGAPDRSRDVYVITEQGRVVISAAGNSANLMKTVLPAATRSEEHTSELQSRENLVCRLLLE